VLLDARHIDSPGADRGMAFQSCRRFAWLAALANDPHRLLPDGPCARCAAGRP
jgi:ABC-type taurine transport system ATPase subunit